MTIDALKLIVISDLHLLADGKTSMGLDNADRLRTCVAAINDRYADADLCVIAGDLADLGERAAYDLLKEILQDLVIPVAITIGNHDDRETFLSVFGHSEAAETGFIDKVIDLAGQRVILLDSAIAFGVHEGALAPEQLEWLGDRLNEAKERPVVVVLHHHANPLHTNVDRIILSNGAEFASVLKRHPDIRQVIAGHVHYTSTAIWHGLLFTTLAGGHYNVTIPLDAPEARIARLSGPGQMAIVLSDAEQTLVHFDNFIDDHRDLDMVDGISA